MNAMTLDCRGSAGWTKQQLRKPLLEHSLGEATALEIRPSSQFYSHQRAELCHVSPRLTASTSDHNQLAAAQGSGLMDWSGSKTAMSTNFTMLESSSRPHADRQSHGDKCSYDIIWSLESDAHHRYQTSSSKRVFRKCAFCVISWASLQNSVMQHYLMLHISK